MSDVDRSKKYSVLIQGRFDCCKVVTAETENGAVNQVLKVLSELEGVSHYGLEFYTEENTTTEILDA